MVDSISGLGTQSAYDALAASQNRLSSLTNSIASGSSLTAESDPSGLSIDQLLRSQSNGLNVASQNAQNGISLLQTAGGGLSQTSDLLSGIRNLALQASNGTLDSTSLAALGQQARQSLAQIDQIASSTSFNGTNLLDGSQSSGLTLQTGASAGDTTSISLPNASAGGLGLSGIDSMIAGGGDMSSVLSAIDNASNSVLSTQTDIGSATNDLTSTIDNLTSSASNISAADSGIAGTDIAAASTQMASEKIKSQFATSLMAQTMHFNQQNALNLLKTLQ